jgi:drug/metabolite transporter (DMT)-like permease
MTQPVQDQAATSGDVGLPSATHVPLTRARSNLLLLLVALIWASAFVAQTVAMRSLGPFMFTGLRFALGAAVVAPFAWREWRMLRARNRQPRRRDLATISGLGTLLFLGSAMQQIGLLTTSVTNGGFLTALYIPLVPVLGWLVLRHLPHRTTWVAAAGCLVGSWLLATGGAGFAAFRTGDWWVIGSSLPWAFHVMLVGRTANRLHGAMLVACGQFFACSAWALAIGLAVEPISLDGVTQALGAIAYTGILSVGLGFTLQVVAQRHARPADAAIVLSSETVFAAAFGALFMGDRLGTGGLAGCALILAGVLVVQLQPMISRRLADTSPRIA